MTKNSVLSVCDVCKVVESSIPGTVHRRCSDKEGGTPTKKHSPRMSRRGTWQKK